MTDEVEEKSEVFQYIEKYGADAYGFSGKMPKIAATLMFELLKSGHASFLLLKDDTVSDWWSAVVSRATKTLDNYHEAMRVYEIKKTAYDKLSPDHRKALGIRKPIQPRDPR